MVWKDKLKESVFDIVAGISLTAICALPAYYIFKAAIKDYSYSYPHGNETEPLSCISPVSCYKKYDGVHFEVCDENGARITFIDFEDNGLDVVVDETGRIWQAEPKYNFGKGRWDYAEPVFPEEYLHMFEELRDPVTEEDMPDNFYRSCDCPPYHCPY